MAMFFSRTVTIPVWLIVFALFAWTGWPMPAAMTVLMLIVGLAVPVIILILGKERAHRVAEVPHQVAGRERSIDGQNSSKNSST